MTLKDLFSSAEVAEISENSNEFRHFEAIGGEHCITAALPQLQDMLGWLEGRCEINLGYYRFVDHPALVTIQKGLAQYFDVHGCLVYSSFRTSLMELLE